MARLTERRIYMDYASATPVLPEAVRAVAKASVMFGNPGAIHAEGVLAKKSLDESRFAISQELACKSREVVFVSGGTEANNLAILGFARKLERVKRGLEGTHWIVASIEHPSVLECFSEVERLGGTVSHVMPDEVGHIKPEAVEELLRPETVFVSVAWANHEIGTVQPLSAISRVLRTFEEKNSSVVIFHSDASQAPLYIAPQVHTLGVDLLSLDSGKLYGPRGIGALYVSNRTELARTMQGGSQERGLRAGTENVALAAGFAVALSHAAKIRTVERARIRDLRDELHKKILALIPNVLVNSTAERALPHVLNISVPNISSEYVTLALDRDGISISTKSACREGEEKQSHVVRALGGDAIASVWRATNTLRFTLGSHTRISDIEIAAAKLAAAVKANARQ